MSLSTPDSVRKLQRALHVRAKGSSDFRFYSLYDKLYRQDILRHAYRCCRANGGSAGVDGVTYGDIESYGAERWLDELAEELREKKYTPQAIRRVYIPKGDGRQRPLGIPTIRDRVVQMSAVLVLVPIFEADLQSEQHAYRPGRSAQDAVQAVHRLVSRGHTEVVDADLRGYFDSIPHGELMRSVSRRVSDGRVLHLIKLWLTVPVEEEDDRGRPRRTTRNRDKGRGIPQGAPISPLLSNIYMRRFILGWKVLGHERRLDAHIVNYADDFVICCRGNALEASRVMRSMMRRLKLTVNEEKTHIACLPEESFDFLGYTICRCYSPVTGRSYIGTRPSRSRVQRLVRRVSEMTRPRYEQYKPEDLVGKLNRVLRGWANYFCLGPVSGDYRAIDVHTGNRLRKWLSGKHKAQGRGVRRYSDSYLCKDLGLLSLTSLPRSFSWAKA